MGHLSTVKVLQAGDISGMLLACELTAMRLQDYLEEQDIPDGEFAVRLGVSIFAIRKWRSGERIPRPENMIKIMRITKNKVSLEDWLR